MALQITDERVRAVAETLHHGGWFYSGRQLYYAVCADAEVPPTRLAPGEVGLGILLVLVGAVSGQRTLLLVLGAMGLVLVAVGAATRVRERRPPPLVRPLAMSYADFEHLLAAVEPLPGLITSRLSPSPVPSAQPGDGPLVVCDRVETAAIVLANLGRIGPARVTVRGTEPDDVRGQRLVVLHDCDPAGCGLVAELRDRGADVVDAGINPEELSGRRLQLLEGAPARLPRDLSGHLDPVQVEWLRSGRRLECATQSSEDLATRVKAALAF